uniref:Cytochrome c oxidase subunit 2 n=1 Tax=Ibidoecus plataleae TaxID=3004258 RepID=A0A9E9IYM0_9NEOP|nr:cytochrome c oxidase subunit II [Ibidoecus plataleae]
MSSIALSLQDSNSSVMVYVSNFHDHVMMVVFSIISVVFYAMMSMLLFPSCNRFLFGNELLELVWTIVPSVVLVAIAVPSLRTLYMMDESSPLMSLKCIGHQWYWSYEYGDFDNVEFSSYMLPDEELESGMFRLLEVDNHTVVPSNAELRLLVTSTDVIHSWTIPSLGVKMDAIPGRVNQFFMNSIRSGLMYGQCSEICGSFHSFMPICLEVIPQDEFLKWVNSFNS